MGLIAFWIFSIALGALCLVMHRATLAFPTAALAVKRLWSNRPKTIANSQPTRDPWQDIRPLPAFDLNKQLPVWNAPLLPRYDLKLDIKPITFSELIAMDRTYLERIQLRQSTMAKYHQDTIQCVPACESAVLELYSWMFGTYLPRRFPSIYYLKEGDSNLINTASGAIIALEPESAAHALETLGAQVDTDFMLLQPAQDDHTPSPEYSVQAFVVCFAAGFSPREEMGSTLARTHAEVPGYKAKMERSVDRFFAKVECGRIVRRDNWSLTTYPELRHPPENVSEPMTSHKPTGDSRCQKTDVVIENCRFRTERQTMFRLPQSNAMVFAYKTYQYTLQEVKDLGHAANVVEAIKGLKKGNVPEMSEYKGAPKWEQAVVGFLGSE